MKKKADAPLVVKGPQDLGKQYKGLRAPARKIGDWNYAATLDPQRFFDWLDGGGKRHNGPFVKFFVDEWNRRYDEQLSHVFDRRDAMQEGLEALDLDMLDFAKVRAEVHGVKFTVDEIMEIQAGLLNEKKRKAIIGGTFGRLLDERGQEAVEGAIDSLLGKLTDEERRAVDLVIQDFENNFDRINLALIDATNQGMKKEEFYTSIHRLEAAMAGGQVIDEATAKAIIDGKVDAGVLAKLDDGFTLSREDIVLENQQPVRLGLFANWHKDVEQQERAAAFAGYVRDVASVLAMKNPKDKNMTLARMIKNRFGNAAWNSLMSNVNLMIRDEISAGHDIFDKGASFLANNASIVYLAWSLGTCAIQTTSVWRFLAYAGPRKLLYNMAKFAADPFIYLGRAMHLLPEDMSTNMGLAAEMDPQLRAREGNVMVRRLNKQRSEIVKKLEMKGVPLVGKYDRFIQLGFEGIAIVDRWTAAIGYTATYEANIARGLTSEQAHREAQRAVLVTQQATTAKDAPVIWRQSGLVRLWMLFTSEAAKSWGMSTYDFVQELQRPGWNEKKAAVATLLSWSLTALMAYFMRNPLPSDDGYDDDPETVADWLRDAFSEEFLKSIPLIGGEAMMLYNRYARGKRGWSQYSAIVAPIAKVLESAHYFATKDEYDDDPEKDLKMAGYAIEGLSLGTGIPVPYTGIKRAIQSSKIWLSDGEPLAAALNRIGRRPRKVEQ